MFLDFNSFINVITSIEKRKKFKILPLDKNITIKVTLAVD